MKNIGIFLFENIELLDFAGPLEVFSVTSELNQDKIINVFTVSQNGKTVRTVNGLNVLPDFSFSNHPPIDILVIPGGAGTRSEINNKDVLNWTMDCYKNSEITFSVCSGARILGRLGLLDGVESITHHEVISEMKEIAPNTVIIQNKRYIDNGKIMTSGGISAGIDLSLHIVEKIFGKAVRHKTQKYMEYGEWNTHN